MAADHLRSTRDADAAFEAVEHVRLIMESVPDFAIFTLDTAGIIRTWNVGARQIFGLAEPDAVGQSGAIIFTPEDRTAGAPEKEMREAREHGRAIDERWHVRKDGSRLYVSGVMAPLVRDGALVGYTKVARDLTERQAMEQELRDARERLEARVEGRTRELETANIALRAEAAERTESDRERMRLLRRLVNAQEEERARICRELHDQLGQEITALGLKLAAIREAPGLDAAARAEVERAQALVRRLDDDVEFLVWQLRPTGLDDLGLAEALADYISLWSSHFAVKAGLRSSLRRRLPGEIESTLYRIVQEALNNVSKHAHASSVDIALETSEGSVLLRVDDDGVGFDPDAPTDSRAMGILGMRERASLVGGCLSIDSSPGKGTRLAVRVPL